MEVMITNNSTDTFLLKGSRRSFMIHNLNAEEQKKENDSMDNYDKGLGNTIEDHTLHDEHVNVHVDCVQ